MVLIFSWATWVLLCLVAIVISLIWLDTKSKSQGSKKMAPGPKSWPIIGSVLYMAKFNTVMEAFEAIGKEFGEFASLKLGSVESVVVSGYENIKQCLLSDKLDSRPGFERFAMLFEGDRNNSLAFADNGVNQKIRRLIVSHHALAKRGSKFFEEFDNISIDKAENLMNDLEEVTTATTTDDNNNSNNEDSTKTTSTPVYLKKHLQDACLQTFLQYFCSLDIDSSNPDYEELRNGFDEIFTEVNNQCVGDIFPALMPFCNKSHLKKFGHPVRKFMMKYCVEPRLQKQQQQQQQEFDSNNNEFDESQNKKAPLDLLDEFLNNIGKSEELTLDNALFALEDMIGGSQALSSLLLQTCLFLAQNPTVQAKLREEVEAITCGETISIENHKLPYAEAIIWEVNRKVGSPLVPHVANQDTTLGDYSIKKGTVLFFNNGELNNSTKYWKDPEAFEPSRFISPEDGCIHKPEFFIPFGTGRRSCLGFKLVVNLAMTVISNLCRQYEISLCEDEEYKITPGSLAVAGKAFKFNLTPIVNQS